MTEKGGGQSPLALRGHRPPTPDVRLTTSCLRLPVKRRLGPGIGCDVADLVQNIRFFRESWFAPAEKEALLSSLEGPRLGSQGYVEWLEEPFAGGSS